jgi:hypothetical protein
MNGFLTQILGLFAGAWLVRFHLFVIELLVPGLEKRTRKEIHLRHIHTIFVIRLFC